MFEAARSSFRTLARRVPSSSALALFLAAPAGLAEVPAPAASGEAAGLEPAGATPSPSEALARRLSEFPEFGGVKVEAKAGVIVLSGRVETPADREALGGIARQLAAPAYVWNKTTLQSAAGPSSGAPGEASPEDDALAARLGQVFANVSELSHVRVEVNSGVVKLSGTVESPTAAERAEQLAQKFPHTLVVDNRVDIDSELPARVKPVFTRLKERWTRWSKNLPLYGVALGVFVLFAVLARFLRRAELPYRMLEGRLVKDIVRRVVATVCVAIGLLITLELLDVTSLVGAVFGAAGVFGVVLGFGLRDIVENYIASVLLSLRRPFAGNDHVVIGDREGKVVRLTSRETILMTLDGNHLRLPNAVVFKAEILNYTRNPLRRFDFVVGLGVTEDIRGAITLGVDTLKNTPGVLGTPPPFARVEELGDSSVALRFFCWVDQREADWYKVRSEAIRHTKVTLDAAGVDMPVPTYQVNLKRDKGTGEHLKPPSGRLPAITADEVAVDDYLERQIEADRELPGETDLLESEP